MTGRDRNVVLGLAVAAVFGAFWFLALAPKRHEAQVLGQQVTQARKDRDAAAQQAASGREAQRTYASNYAAVARLGKAVPTDDQTASLLYQLQAVAGRSHVAFTSILPKDAPAAPGAAAATATGAASPAPGGVSEVPFALTFSGTYSDLEHFLRRVHRLTTLHGKAIRVRGRLLAVSGLTLATKSGTPRIQASVTASAYLAAPAVVAAAAPVAGAAPAPAASSPAPAAGTAAILGAGR